MVPRTRRNTVRSPSLRFMSSGQLQAFSHEKKRTVREFSALSFSFPFLFPFLFLFSFRRRVAEEFRDSPHGVLAEQTCEFCVFLSRNLYGNE